MIDLSLSFPSKALLRPVQITAGMPDIFSLSHPPWKVVWALHCALGNGRLFFSKLNASTLIDDLGFVLIAPDLGNGWFCDSEYEAQAEFLNEMLYALGDLLPLSKLATDNSVLGISMGGFGAIRWALASNNFSKAVSISGFFDNNITPDERIKKDRAQKAIYMSLKKNIAKFPLSEQMHLALDSAFPGERNASGFLTHVYLYCGEQDCLALPQNMELEKRLVSHNIPVTLLLEPGGHDAAFWQRAFFQAIHSLFSTPLLS